MPSATQRAARYYGPGDVRIETDVARPTTKPGQIKIQPSYVGICGTDVHEYSTISFAPVDPHPVTKEQIPIGTGHEFSGTVLELGEGVSGFEVGQKICVQPTIYCGSCGPCDYGAENACANGGFIGLSGWGGGMSEEVCVPADQVFALPPDIDLDVGALVEPLAVAWHAVDASPLAEFKKGEANCVVFGGGPIGLAVIQVLLARGAKTVICVEVAAKRKQFAQDFGAQHIIDPTQQDVVTVCRELCGGQNGPDIAFDCAGVAQSLQTSCNVVRSRGAIVNVAIWEKEVPFNPNWLVFREAKYSAVLGYQKKDFQGVVDALAKGTLKPKNMITSVIPLEDLVEKGYMSLINHKDQHVKILVDVRAGL